MSGYPSRVTLAEVHVFCHVPYRYSYSRCRFPLNTSPIPHANTLVIIPTDLQWKLTLPPALCPCGRTESSFTHLRLFRSTPVHTPFFISPSPSPPFPFPCLSSEHLETFLELKHKNHSPFRRYRLDTCFRTFVGRGV